MPSLTCFNFRFTPSWFMTSLACFFILLFISLGCWQLRRGEEKTKMLTSQQALSKQPPLSWTAGQKLPLQYQAIITQGHYRLPLFLLDNQHQAHQYGYNVLSPLALNDGSIVMIDRGWILSSSWNHIIPGHNFSSSLMSVTGNAYFPAKNQWLLGPPLEKKDNQVFLIELIDLKLISQILQKKVHPFIIRLNKKESYGFVRNWPIVSMPPQRHFAYAMQWFTMALVIFIIFIALNVKRK